MSIRDFHVLLTVRDTKRITYTVCAISIFLDSIYSARQL